ncbi:MAG: LysR family transcriptional regulator, partial [Comamonas sp.]|nr:LysR family transcriptional regulator [Candidatus Comamonas equi]
IPPMLVEAEIARGELVVACAQPLRGERSYYLVSPSSSPSPVLAVFTQWLCHMANSPSHLAM